MGMYVETIYVERNINNPVLHWIANHNSWLLADDPEAVVSATEENLGFYPEKEQSNFWDIKIEKGIDMVSVTIPGNRYIAIWTDNLETACSNMNKQTRRKWKRRIVELIKRSVNRE